MVLVGAGFIPAQNRFGFFGAEFIPVLLVPVKKLYCFCRGRAGARPFYPRPNNFIIQTN